MSYIAKHKPKAIIHKRSFSSLRVALDNVFWRLALLCFTDVSQKAGVHKRSFSLLRGALDTCFLTSRFLERK
jgi:hypothetical protein